MHHRAPTPRPAWLYRSLRGLTILLLPAWLLENVHPAAMPPGRIAPAPATQSSPYLVAVGPVPLRFKDPAPPPPDLVARPVAGGPPQPEAPALTPAPELVAAVKQPPVAAAPKPPPAPRPADTTAPPPLLSDEIRPKVRAEDFLPFFQFPASGDVTIVTPIPPTAPTPGQAPPSSAIYRQQ